MEGWVNRLDESMDTAPLVRCVLQVVDRHVHGVKGKPLWALNGSWGLIVVQAVQAMQVTPSSALRTASRICGSLQHAVACDSMVHGSYRNTAFQAWEPDCGVMLSC